MPVDPSEPVVTTLVCLNLNFAREAAGAAGTRHSLRPLFSWANGFVKSSGASRRESVGLCLIGCLKIRSTPSSSSRRDDPRVRTLLRKIIHLPNPGADVGEHVGQHRLDLRNRHAGLDARVI